MITKLQFWLLTATATYLSLTPKPGAIFESFSDKFLHTLCWFVLFLSLLIAYRPERHHLTYYAGGLFLYASLIEMLQIWVPGRFFSWWDILANLSGIVLGYSLVRVIIIPLKKFNRAILKD